MKSAQWCGVMGILLVFAGVSTHAADDKTELEGVWEQTKLVVDGVEKAVAADTKMTIRGHTTSLATAGKVAFSGEFKIDDTKTPKALVSTYKEGPNKGKTVKSIYKIEGDKVIFCRGAIGGERPAEFVSKPGSGTLYSEYKRIAP